MRALPLPSTSSPASHETDTRGAPAQTVSTGWASRRYQKRLVRARVRAPARPSPVWPNAVVRWRLMLDAGVGRDARVECVGQLHRGLSAGLRRCGTRRLLASVRGSFRWSLETAGCGQGADDSFDCASEDEQITIATGGPIELETEWKPFRVQSHRQGDSGNAGGVRRMRVTRQERAVTSLPPTWNLHWYSTTERDQLR